MLLPVPNRLLAMRTRNGLLCLLATSLLILCLVPRPADGLTTFYLDASSPTDGNGTQSYPFNNADSAFNAINQIYYNSETGEDIILNIAAGEYPTTSGIRPVEAPTGSLDVNGPTTGEAVFNVIGGDMIIDFYCSSYGNRANINHITIQNCRVDSSSAIQISGCYESLIDHVTIRNCSGGYPRTMMVDGNTTITNSRFEDNVVTSVLYGRTNSYGDHIEISNTVFTNNVDVGYGYDYGMLDVDYDNAGYARISDCQFTNNRYTTGSVLLVQTGPGYIYRSLFTNNGGDSIVNASQSQLYIEQSNIILNPNTTSGGVTARFGAGNVTLVRTSVWQNSVDMQCIGGGNIGNDQGISFCSYSCLDNKRMDRCNVCDGNDTCVGCDNVAFSNTTSCTFAPPISVNDPESAASTTLAAWTGNSPSPTLVDKNNVAGDTAALELRLETLAEIDSTGGVVISYDLETIPWYIVSTIGTGFYGRVFYRYFPGPSGTIVRLDEIYYLSASNLTSGNVSFDIDGFQLKLAMAVTNWPFASSDNSLVLTLSVIANSPFTSAASSISQISGFDFESVSISTSGSQIDIGLPHWAVFDGSTQAITVGGSTVGNSAATFNFSFPASFTMLDYDPNFGVVLSPTGDDSEDDNLGLTIGLAVGLPFAFAVVVCVIMIGTVLLWFNRRRLRRMYSTTKTLGSSDADEM